MSNVLLLLSPSANAPAAIRRAISRTKEMRADLVVLVALPRAAVDELAGTLIDDAFVGDRISDDVVDALRREQRALAQDLLHEISEQAKKEGVNVIGRIDTGEPSEVCGPVVAAYNVHTIVLSGHRRTWLASWWSRATATEWTSTLGCEVEIVDE